MKINGVEVVIIDNQDGTFKAELGPKILGENFPDKKSAYTAALECAGVFGNKNDSQDRAVRQE
jgi:hypothetical protein